MIDYLQKNILVVLVIIFLIGSGIVGMVKDGVGAAINRDTTTITNPFDFEQGLTSTTGVYSGTVAITGALTQTGAATLSSTLGVTGATILSSTLNVSSATSTMATTTLVRIGVGTTTPLSLGHFEDTSATSTITVSSGSASSGGRIILEDTDGAGCSEISILDGTIIVETVTCPAGI